MLKIDFMQIKILSLCLEKDINSLRLCDKICINKTKNKSKAIYVIIRNMQKCGKTKIISPDTGLV